MDFLLRERQVFHDRLQAIIGCQHHRPVVDESVAYDVVVHLVLYLVQGSLPSVIPTCVEILTVFHHLHRDIRRTHVPELDELLVFVCLSLGMGTLLGFQEHHPRHQGDIYRRHFLTSEQYAAIHVRSFPSLSVGRTLDSSCMVIDSFQEINVLPTQHVLVLVEMHYHVADLRTLISHGEIGCTVKVADLWIALEETYQGYGELSLASSLLSVNVEYRERACAVGDDVLEQRGKIKANGYDSIVTIQLTQQGEVFLWRHDSLGVVEETPLVGIAHLVPDMKLRHGREINILVFKSDDAILINRFPLAFIDHAIAKGIEAFLAKVVPAHLGHSDRLFCLAIHISLQKLILLRLLEKAEITLSLYFFLESFQSGNISLLKFDRSLHAVLILQLENSCRVLLVGNKKQRMDNKIAPVPFFSLWIQIIIMVVLAIKAKALQLIGLLDGLSLFHLFSPA